MAVLISIRGGSWDEPSSRLPFAPDVVGIRVGFEVTYGGNPTHDSLQTQRSRDRC